ncbi:MAG TPA: hypothetical protein DIS80_03375 [Verrucomicrobiales bacterium]|nr:hypothetical protein [Verrucomicrobiales bacterium]
MGEKGGWMMRFSSSSWALVRHGLLPMLYGYARGHGFFAGILMGSRKSVPASGENESHPCLG